MAYNQLLAKRISEGLLKEHIPFEEKKMFGGVAFMIQDKMCLGVTKDRLMLRVLDEKYEDTLRMDHVTPMEFTGRTAKGFVFVEEKGFSTAAALKKWIALGIEFGKLGKLKNKKKMAKRL